MTDTTPYNVPQEPGRWRAIVFAALVHALLLGFLWIGVRWQSETPATLEAEVWSPQPKEAAPAPQPPVVERKPEPEPEPVVRAVPKPPEVDDEPPVVKPDIALEQEKKRKLDEAKKRLAEEKERLAKLEKQAEQKRIEQEKAEAAKKLARAEQEKAEAARKLARAEQEKAEQAKKAAADKKRKQEEAEEQLLAKIREEDMRRITGGVTGTGGAGDAAKSQGGRSDGGYAARVGAKIKSNIAFNTPDELSGNPPVEYVVDLLPDGSIAGMRKTKSSGVPGFDEAVRRAIEKSQPYPKDKSGSVPSSFIGIHKPKDQ